MRKLYSIIVLLSIALLSATAQGQGVDARPTARDIAGLSRLSDVQLSPDGSRVVYAVATKTFDEDVKPSSTDDTGGWTRERQLWLASAEGSDARQITFNEEKTGSPRWAPDGSSIGFLRERDEKTQIHILPLAGGEARIIDTGDLEPEDYVFSPDGEMIIFLATPDDPEKQQDDDWAAGGVLNYDKRFRSSRLYSIPIEGGAVRSITDGAYHINRFALSPANSYIALVTSASADPYDAFTQLSVRIIDGDSGSEIGTLTDKPRIIGEVRWSPNSSRIAYEAAHSTLSLLNALWVVDIANNASRNLAAEHDLTLGGFVWSRDSRYLVAHVQDKTESKLVRLRADGGKREDLDFTGRVIGGSLSPSAAQNSFACATSTVASPPAPTIINARTGEWRLVADVNPQVKDWSEVEWEVLSWESPEGMQIEGVLVKTPHVAPGEIAPLMVMPHGGPDSVTTQGWRYRPQFFTARGFNVFQPNYRGGTGYGWDFYAANRGRLGEIEFMDIESGVDALIERGMADPERLVYGGWSWGGYLSAWTIGHTDRYQAAVVGAGVNDTVSQYALSDINHGAAAQWEYKGDPWRQFEQFDRANPIRHISSASTPTLIIHGQEDDRVSFSAGIILYRALKDVGCETKFLAYPREPHGFREPAHVEHMLDSWAQWYDEHLTQ